MMKCLLVLMVFISARSAAQELYVFTDPASNNPAHSLSAKISHQLAGRNSANGRVSHRVVPEVYIGVSKNLMLRASAGFANMHTTDFRFESLGFYAKYRFLSKDELHRHFRMAAFVEGSHTRAPFHFDEISLMGDKSGVEAGLIATQLWNKFALSTTLSHTQVLDASRKSDVIYVPSRDYQALNFSLSGGYLLLPRVYTDYRQTNLNLYLELLGQRTLDKGRYYIDLAPAIQFIFNSNAKLNIGRRMQLGSDMDRMAANTWLLSFERTFLNAFGKR